MRALVFLGAMVLATIANDADAAMWWWLNTSAGSNEFFGDQSSILISADGNLRSVWILTVKSDEKNRIKSSKSLYAIICSSSMIANLQSVDYDVDGNVLKHYDNPENYYRIIPETGGEDVKNFACSQQATWEKQGFSGPIPAPYDLARILHPKPKAPRRRN